MKFLRRFLFIFLLTILTVVLIGFLLPRHAQVKRSIRITADKDLIFEQLNELKNWEHWSPWYFRDSNMMIRYSEPSSGNGANFQFSSLNKTVGQGIISIISSVPDDSIVLDMDFMDHGKVTSIFRLQDAEKSTMLEWNLQSDLGMNPLSRWFGLLMDNLVGKDAEQGLNNLSAYIASMPVSNSYNITRISLPRRIIVSIRDTASPATIQKKLSQIYKRISGFIQANNLTVTGAPFTMYHHYSLQSYDVEAGLPVSILTQSKEDIVCRELPVTEAIMATFHGSYQETSLAYDAIEDFIHKRGLSISGVPWEVYLTDPASEPDTSKWQTDIYYPVK